jgi:hypothetical protein
MIASKRNVSRSMCVVCFTFSAFTANAQVAINTAAVSAGGITSCDTAGFPATICARGSYILTSNLAVLSTTTDAIDINADDVILDLNGFSVSSGNTCTGGGPNVGNSCYGSGATSQVLINISGSRVVLKNGNVLGSRGDGIHITRDDVTVDGVQLSQSSFRGVYVAVNGDPPSILNSSVTLNGGPGYLSNSNGTGGGLIRNSSFSYNYSGVQLEQGVMDHVVANWNIGYGIQAGSSTLNGASAIGNGSTGILYGRVVRDAVSDQNVVDGFGNGSNSTVYINSSAIGNSGKGFNLTSTACYSNIQASSNTGGQISGGVQLTGTHVTCP